MNTPLFTPFERPETLGSSVRAQIKDLLLSGQLEPGEQLSLRSMAAALGVSVMPVREAVNQLVADQALEVAPNRAIRVPRMSRDQFTEITQIRIEIEGYAVAQACERINNEDLTKLEELNLQLARAMESKETSRDVVSLNKEFHFTAYAASGMPMLVKFIEPLWLRIGPILNYDLRQGSERIQNQTAVRHHAQIIAGFRARDVQMAREGLRNDISSAYEHILLKHYTCGQE